MMNGTASIPSLRGQGKGLGMWVMVWSYVYLWRTMDRWPNSFPVFFSRIFRIPSHESKHRIYIYIYIFVLSTFYWNMTLDDNLAGISMSAKKGVVEDTNAETIRFGKRIASHGLDDPQQLYNQHWFFIYRNCPRPTPHKRSTNLQII